MADKEQEMLLDREQMLEMSLEELEEYQLHVEGKIESIKTSLEYDDGDDDWYGRAKGALTVHNICLKKLKRVFHESTVLSQKALKAQKSRNKALKVGKEVEQKVDAELHQAMRLKSQALAVEKTKFNAIAQRVALIDRVSYNLIFNQICRKKLPEELFKEITLEAEEEQKRRIEIEVSDG